MITITGQGDIDEHVMSLTQNNLPPNNFPTNIPGWDDATVYERDQRVIGGDGEIYVSLIATNVGNDPGEMDPDFETWEVSEETWEVSEDEAPEPAPATALLPHTGTRVEVERNGKWLLATVGVKSPNQQTYGPKLSIVATVDGEKALSSLLYGGNRWRLPAVADAAYSDGEHMGVGDEHVPADDYDFYRPSVAEFKRLSDLVGDDEMLVRTMDEIGMEVPKILDGGADDDKTKPTPVSAQPMLIPLSSIVQSDFQPRELFDQAAHEDLTKSIETHGVLQAILVRPHPSQAKKYELVAGERRCRAAEAAGLTEIPALIKTGMSDEDASVAALIENLQRERLKPIEAAKGIQRLVTLFGWTQTKIAESLSSSQSAIANRLRLLSLPDDVQAYIENDTLSESHGIALCSLDSSNDQRKFALWAINESLPVSQLRVMIGEHKAKIAAENQAPLFEAGEVAASSALAADPPDQEAERLAQGDTDRGETTDEDPNTGVDTTGGVSGEPVVLEQPDLQNDDAPDDNEDADGGYAQEPPVPAEPPHPTLDLGL